MYPYLHIGAHIHIPMYNLCIGIGIVAAMLLLQQGSAFRHLAAEQQHRLRLSLLLTVLTGFAGAYLFDAFTQRQQGHLLSASGGLTLMGGMLAGILCLALCLRLSRTPILPTLNMLAAPFALAHFFGRLGCFFGGCCFGRPTHFFTGLSFPRGSLPYRHYHSTVAIHPTQLYEAGFALCLCLLLLRYRPRQSFAIYLLSYSVFRFFAEYLRADDRGLLFTGAALSPSQWLSLLGIAGATVLYLATRRSTVTGSMP